MNQKGLDFNEFMRFYLDNIPGNYMTTPELKRFEETLADFSNDDLVQVMRKALQEYVKRYSNGYETPSNKTDKLLSQITRKIPTMTESQLKQLSTIGIHGLMVSTVRSVEKHSSRHQK